MANQAAAIGSHAKKWFAAAALVLGFSSVANVARADVPADAWAQAKPRLAASVTTVVGIDVAAAKSSSMFAKLYPELLKQTPGGRDFVERAKTLCGIDPIGVIQSVVVAFDDLATGVVFVSTKGLDQEKVRDCIAKVGWASDKAAVTASKADAKGIVDFASPSINVHMAILPKGVIAFPSNLSDRALLVKWVTGAGAVAGSDEGKALAQADTSATAWFATTKASMWTKTGPLANIRRAAGAISIRAGQVTGQATAGFSAAKDAKAGSDELSAELREARQSMLTPPVIAGFLNSISVTSTGTSVTVRGLISESDCLAVIGIVLGHSL